MAQTLSTKELAALTGVKPHERGGRTMTALVLESVKERGFAEARYCADLTERARACYDVAVAAQGVGYMLTTGRLDAETTLDLREMRPYRVLAVVAKLTARLGGATFGGDRAEAQMIREIVKEVRG